MNAHKRRSKGIVLSALVCVPLRLVSQDTATFKTSTQLVVETVGVKDKSGKPIEGLTSKDFTVTEDGTPQTIRFFEYQKLDEIPSEPVAGPPPVVTVYQKFPHTQISPEQPGNTRYRAHRLMALYFDMTAMPVSDQLRAFTAATK